MSRVEERISDGQAPEVDQAEPRKPARRILEQELIEGLGELRRPATGLFISGLSGGLDVGFSLFLIGVTITLLNGEMASPLARFLIANVYTVGFIFVIIGRSELFTEHTTLATLPVLHGEASVGTLARLWFLIYVSNMIGAAIFARIATIIGPSLGVIDRSVFGAFANHVLDHPWWVIMLSGVLAGWLMGLLSWLVTAGRDTISQILLVWLVTFAIGLGGLHHVVVGAVEVLAGLFTDPTLTFRHFLNFLLWVTIGNSIGGFFFVSVLKYGHVVRGPASVPQSQAEVKE